VLNFRNLSLLFLAATLSSIGCRAQTPAVTTAGKPLPPAVARRVEVLLRQKAQLPPNSSISIGTPTSSELPGYFTVAVTFTTDGKSSHPVNFLLASDGKTLAQFNKYDISGDPRALVSAEGRPSRGGPGTAPVLIVGFDDLECPYCARLHESIFPAITQRYGDKVHIVYKDFPLEQHPWAMHAAVDVNCIGQLSTPGYWNVIDYIHAHASEIGAPDPTAPKDPAAGASGKTVSSANTQLDKIVRDQGTFQKVDAAKLDACLTKQNTDDIEASKKVGVAIGVESTPVLFINGDKIDGAVPIEFIFNIIDEALRAQNVTPPPPFVEPTVSPVAITPPPANPGR
jgi:protein-disulfide isomerase